MSPDQFFRSSFPRFSYLLKNTAIFPLLLPAFFVLHGTVYNLGAIAFMDALLLAVLYLLVTSIIIGIAWFFYRDFFKAGILAFFIMAFQFFFGFIQDRLTSLAPHSFISQYRFILPVCCLFFIALAVWLKKRKKTLFGVTYYLNIVLLLLLLIDSGLLLIKTIQKKKPSFSYSEKDLRACERCATPDIYFIVLDEYAGDAGLKNVFNFDNSTFNSELIRRGFQVSTRSTSNYNLTPYSIASTLNMDYLDASATIPGRLNLNYVYGTIKNNTVVSFFKNQGYRFFNLSVFDFPGQPAHKYGEFIPYGTELISSQTFTKRVIKALRNDVLSGKLPFTAWRKKILYDYLDFNDEIFQQTRKVATQKTSVPKFVYTHLLMPHWPYYYDSKGQLVPEERLRGFHKESASRDYTEYLLYGNEKILQLVDDIFQASPSPPVIILMGDHGFRLPINSEAYKYEFSNLSAVFVPDKTRKPFPDSLSNVNFFRILLDSCFDQRLPLLKDSTINLSMHTHLTIN
ncbi:MAG TPA: sulfatase-like hydrolase/transferase [Chitinophagaceae bacterium]|nr:sulfatase-like hydrolase/transferase [Chitinophagaceae bacterium]